MDFNFKNNPAFLNLIKGKEEQILARTNDEIQDSEGFKIIFAGLKSMLKNNAFNGFKAVIMSEQDIIQVRIEDVGDFNKLFSNEDFTYHNLITLDKELHIIDKERKTFPSDSNEARTTFSQISQTGFVTFLLIKKQINYFIKGIDNSESPFFSLIDINRYNKKRDINEINDVFVEYQESIKERRNYCKFFVELSHIKSLREDLQIPKDEEDKFIKSNKHLLRNKPEDTFRDDLRLFLTSHLRVFQVKEFLLENMRRLDIFLYDEFGEIYLIEVKWVGQSIHQLGKKLGTIYDAKNINPDAFIQTMDYLEELDNKGQNIVRAYLVVFDARQDNLDDTGSNFDTNILNESQTKHYRKFDKVKDFRVINHHAS
jgi:hypothetical protein